MKGSVRVPLMRHISLTRTEAIDVLIAVDAAIEHVPQTRAYALVIHLLAAAELLGARLYPQLPPAV